MHWPFCARKCPYCDFNSHVRTALPEAAWLAKILDELRYEQERTPGQLLTSIFFGGGTPSLMQPESAAAIIEAATGLWPCADEVEITLEANPSTVEAERFAGFRAAGVNRTSLGIQALDDTDLTRLGRTHDLAEALAALEAAQRNFDRVSFDLIYAREGQTPGAWERELERALAFGTEHLSLYQLTIEPGTHFATRYARGELVLPAEDPAAEMFELTRARCRTAGLAPYETSNFARFGAESRHNLSYWQYGDYAGVGPGAHGRRSHAATVRTRLPERWLASGPAPETETPLPAQERAAEALMMGLRLETGIDPDGFLDRTGVPLSGAIDAAALSRLSELSLVEAEPRLRLTERGALLLDRIAAELLADDLAATLASAA
ncbi:MULTISPECIES: radical SAM family heme chaperone HemW [Pacificimonas]|uniref:radical SAM family heme chaperone HemW n=1 Tax=Pacificimonas TaxID=1960290 RepID=UPI001FB1A1EE|nr:MULTISPECIES: radical SAM family heme chaperone HemW [Pacificimonas]